MEWTSELDRINDILAGLYSKTSEIERLVRRAKLRNRDVDFGGSASDVWPRVIEKAVDSGTLDLLVEACLKEYDNDKLKKAYEDYVSVPVSQPANGTRSVDETTIRLPIHPTLIGRTKEIQECTDLLKHPTRHLLTLTGPIGVGKTALAKYLAVSRAGDFKHGVSCVSLASLKDQLSLPIEIGNAMEDYKQTVGAPLTPFLRDKQRLIVLDNFNPVINDVSLVTTIITDCPQVKIIVTSQQHLATPGSDLEPFEQRYPVPPLLYPGASGDDGTVPPAEMAAVQFFIARAEVVKGKSKGGLAFTPEDMEAIANICREVNGLPLCIQIVANFISAYDPQRLLQFLTDDEFTTLDEGKRLNTAIKMGYANLEVDEQILFRRLAVFAGRCTFDDIQKVCGSVNGESVPVFTTVKWLVDKSFLQPEGGQYQMLQVFRQYARKQLDATAEADPLRKKYANYYLELAQKDALNFKKPDRKKHLQGLEQNYEHFRAVFHWSTSPRGRLEVGLSLVGALFWFWNFRAYFREGRRQATRILSFAASQEPSAAYASALYCDGGLAFLLGEYREAQIQLTKSVDMWRIVDDNSGLAYALIILGMVKKELGEDLDAARQHEEESVRLMESLKDDWGHALALNDLANVMVAQGEHQYADARRNYEESERKWKKLKEPWGRSLVLSNLSSLECKQCDYDSAYTLMKDALRIQEKENDQWGRAWSFKGLGESKLGKMDYTAAASYFYKSFCLHSELGRKQLVAECLEGLAKVAAGLDEPNRAAYLMGAAERLRTEVGTIQHYAKDKGFETLLKNLRDKLGPTQFDNERGEGDPVNPEELQRKVHSFLQEWKRKTSARLRACSSPSQRSRRRKHIFLEDKDGT